MKKIIILLFIFYSISSTTLAQSLFTKIFDTGNFEHSNGNILTSENIFLNHGHVFKEPNVIPYLATFDLDGNLLNAKMLINFKTSVTGTKGYGLRNSVVIELKNGSFILLAEIDSVILLGGGGTGDKKDYRHNTLVCNFDKNLNIIWIKLLGRSFNSDNNVVMYDVIETANGELVMVGNNEKSAQIIKMDLLGNVLAYKDLTLVGSIKSSILYRIKYNPITGKYIALGNQSNGFNNQDVIYCVIDENLNVSTQKVIETVPLSGMDNVMIDALGNTIIVGYTKVTPPSIETMLISISTNNTINWAFNYLLNGTENSFGIDLFPELGGLKLIGFTNNTAKLDYGDTYIIPLTSNGLISNTGSSYSINGDEYLTSVLKMGNKYVVSGSVDAFLDANGNPRSKAGDVFINVVDSLGTVPCSTIVVPVSVPLVALVTDVISTSTKTIYSSNISFTTSSFSFKEKENPVSGKVQYTGSLNICEPEVKRLSCSILSSFYLWSNGANSKNINVSKSGAYYVQTLGPNGCLVNSDTVILTVNPMPAKPVITNNRPLQFCEGDSTILLAPAGFSYLWSKGDTTRSIIVKKSGTFNVIISNANGCKSKSDNITTTIITPNKPIISHKYISNTFCGIDTLTATASTSYKWSNGDTSQSIIVNKGGKYLVTTNANGACLSTSDTLNLINFSEVLPVIVAPTIVCFGDSITLFSSNMSNDYTAHWVLPDGSEDTSRNLKVIHNFETSSGDFSLNFTLKNCESQTAKASILLSAEIKSILLNNYIKCNEAPVTLDAKVAFTNATYSWNTGSTAPSILASDTGNYSVNINVNGCSKLITTKILSYDCDFRINIPSAFSPNEDGNNEVFNIVANQELKAYSLKIFDRWGENVFTSDDINARWDGKTTNGTLVSGTYVWLLQYTPMKGSKKTEKGLINITR